MQLHVLLDNNTLIDRYFVGEPAVSYLIEEGDLRILFDVGYSDILSASPATAASPCLPLHRSGF